MVRAPANPCTEGGFALLLALFVAAIASAAVLLSTAALKLEYDTTRREATRIRLDAMVDAVIAETLADPQLTAVVQRPFEAGWIESRVERQENRVTIRARAVLGGRVREAEVKTLLTVTGPRVLSWRPIDDRR